MVGEPLPPTHPRPGHGVNPPLHPFTLSTAPHRHSPNRHQESARRGAQIDYNEFLNSKALTSGAHAALGGQSLDQFYQNRELLSHLYT